MESSSTLILASASPRRAELLTQVGLKFEVRVSNVPEKLSAGERPNAYVQRLASDKANAVFRSLDSATAPHKVVLAADTIVTVDGEILEKPVDFADAQRMWMLLSGSSHEVCTGVCVVSEQNQATLAVTTSVAFAALSSESMRHYWETGEPQGKAGAYAIQGRASAWVESLSGSFSNVVGLPLYETNKLLTPYGLNWL